MEKDQLSDKKQSINIFVLLSFIIAIISLLFSIVVLITHSTLFFMTLSANNSLFLYGSIASIAIGVVFTPVISLIGVIFGIIALTTKDKSKISIIGLIINVIIFLLSIMILIFLIELIMFLALIVIIGLLFILLLNFLINKYVPLGF